MIKIEVFNQNLLKYWYLQHCIHSIKRIGDYKDINSANPLYLIISKVLGHIEEKNGSKYLFLILHMKTKKYLKKYTKLWDGIENEINTINGDKEVEY